MSYQAIFFDFKYLKIREAGHGANIIMGVGEDQAHEEFRVASNNAHGVWL